MQKNAKLCGTHPRRASSLPADSLRVGHLMVAPSPVVRCLGVLIDKEVSFRPHVIRVAASCFGALRQIRSVRRSLPRHLIIKLVESLVIPLLGFLHFSPCWNSTQACRQDSVTSQCKRSPDF